MITESLQDEIDYVSNIYMLLTLPKTELQSSKEK
jgi:hypothetical protein